VRLCASSAIGQAEPIPLLELERSASDSEHTKELSQVVADAFVDRIREVGCIHQGIYWHTKAKSATIAPCQKSFFRDPWCNTMVPDGGVRLRHADGLARRASAFHIGKPDMSPSSSDSSLASSRPAVAVRSFIYSVEYCRRLSTAPDRMASPGC
jgi:hypothetical protein